MTRPIYEVSFDIFYKVYDPNYPEIFGDYVIKFKKNNTIYIRNISKQHTAIFPDNEKIMFPDYMVKKAPLNEIIDLVIAGIKFLT